MNGQGEDSGGMISEDTDIDEPSARYRMGEGSWFREVLARDLSLLDVLDMPPIKMKILAWVSRFLGGNRAEICGGGLGKW